MEMQTITTSEISTDPNSEYYRISGGKCVCNGYCSFCSGHRCVFCFMVGWIIFGALNVLIASTDLVFISDGEWYTSSCTVNDSFYDNCCVDNNGLLVLNGAVNAVGIDCDDIETVYTVSWLFHIC